jgi:hypothetical protein
VSACVRACVRANQNLSDVLNPGLTPEFNSRLNFNFRLHAIDVFCENEVFVDLRNNDGRKPLQNSKEI